MPRLLSNVATLTRDSIPTNTNQANIQPVYEIGSSRNRVGEFRV